jgi:hypothetical protein
MILVIPPAQTTQQISHQLLPTEMKQLDSNQVVVVNTLVQPQHRPRE